MMKETGSINRSLFTLGKVIATLSRGETFVPYRDSKLTKLLMDSLGGSSSCVMVACCSPSGRFVEETLSTLQYASRAKSICNKPILQLDPSQRLIQQLRTEIQALRAENMQLRIQQGIPAGEKIMPSSMALLRLQEHEEAGREAGRQREALGSPSSPKPEETFSRSSSSLSMRGSNKLNGTGGGDPLYEKVKQQQQLGSLPSSPSALPPTAPPLPPLLVVPFPCSPSFPSLLIPLNNATSSCFSSFLFLFLVPFNRTT